MINLDYENKIFTVEENGITLKVEPDNFPVNPRDISDGNTTMLIWNHPDFWGDENPYESYVDFVKTALDTNEPINYDNSIFTHIFFNTETNTITDKNTKTSYHLGIIYMPNETAIKECGGIKAGYERLKQDIENYSNFVRGDFYSYRFRHAKQSFTRRKQYSFPRKYA